MNANKHGLGSDMGLVDAHVLQTHEYDDLPELGDADLSRQDAVWRVAGLQVSPQQGRAAFSAALKKQKINITLDPDVLSWYRLKAGGRGYQTLINATLREAMRGQEVEQTLRRVIREELQRAA